MTLRVRQALRPRRRILQRNERGWKIIRDLKGTIERECAEIGLFITLEAPSKPMLPLLLMPTYQQAERIPAKQAAEQKELFG